MFCVNTHDRGVESAIDGETVASRGGNPLTRPIFGAGFPDPAPLVEKIAQRLRWPRLAWIHLPCAAWGAFVELAGWICPLTPLENRLRQAAGEARFEGGFVEHYVIPLLYPGNLTREMQMALGLLVIGLNVLVYATVWRRARAHLPGG